MLNEVKHLGVKMEILRFAQDDVHMLRNQFIWLKGIAACKGQFPSNLTSQTRSPLLRVTSPGLSMTSRDDALPCVRSAA